MPKISMIGAGSAVFAKNLLGDILQFPELSDCNVSLMDIDEARLQTSERMANKLAEALDVNPTIEATDDAERALDGADYCINMIQVAGYKPGTATDFEVPKKYGL
ncbi:MAG: alpha-glucosidase/alpha-galactosidase, partial [Armatimonadota bacterium]